MNVYGIVGRKDAGTTMLMERLVSEICGRGFTVSTVKQTEPDFDVDQPGKDSHRHRDAGAREVLLSSRKRFALMHELCGDDAVELEVLLAKLAPVDLVLIEGYENSDHPKIEAFRAETGDLLIAEKDGRIRAAASDCDLALDRPVFDLDATVEIADFILQEVGLV